MSWLSRQLARQYADIALQPLADAFSLISCIEIEYFILSHYHSHFSHIAVFTSPQSETFIERRDTLRPEATLREASHIAFLIEADTG
jgi:hypothetical protein